MLERIITRPEDLPEQVEKNIRKYKLNILRILEVKFNELLANTKLNSLRILEVKFNGLLANASLTLSE